MTTIEDVKEFIALMSEAISLHNDITNDNITSLKEIEVKENLYEEVCRKLIENRIVNKGGIFEGVFPFTKSKTE
jgi:hypothetical protein